MSPEIIFPKLEIVLSKSKSKEIKFPNTLVSPIYRYDHWNIVYPFQPYLNSHLYGFCMGKLEVSVTILFSSVLLKF